MSDQIVFANDVKRGWIVELTDGSEATVEDNGRGIIRNISINGDWGSSYIDTWRKARKDNLEPWMKVELSPKQQTMMKNVNRDLSNLF